MGSRFDILVTQLQDLKAQSLSQSHQFQVQTQSQLHEFQVQSQSQFDELRTQIEQKKARPHIRSLTTARPLGTSRAHTMQFSLFDVGMGTATAIWTLMVVGLAYYLLPVGKGLDALIKLFDHLQRLLGPQ